MTVPRSEWKGKEEGVALVEKFNTFGWIVHRHVLPPGSSLSIIAKSTIPRQNAPNKCLYVKGTATVVNDIIGPIDNRVPGLFTDERPDHPEGISKVTAIDELEFWCFNWHANRRALPNLTPIRLVNGGTVTVPLNSKVLVCFGELNGYTAGSSFTTSTTTITANSTSYGLIIGEARV